MKKKRKNSPLEIIWPRIPMLLAWTKWTYIPRGIMNEPMSNHFVFALESSATRAAQTSFNWTEMRSILRMYICM